MTDPRCLHDTFGLKRTCGIPSTYNNARCRGEKCRAALAAYRAAYRARQSKPIKGKTEPEED